MKLFEFLRKSSALVMGVLMANVLGFESPQDAQSSDLEAAGWQARFDKAEENLTGLNAQYEAVVDERDNLKTQVSQLQAQVTQLQSAKDALDTQIITLNQEKADLQAKLDKAPEMVVPGSTAEQDPPSPDEKDKQALAKRIDEMPHNRKADSMMALLGTSKQE